MKTNDLIRFTAPLPDETDLTMRIIEMRGDRMLVEYLVGMNINPTGIVQVSDMETDISRNPEIKQLWRIISLY